MKPLRLSLLFLGSLALLAALLVALAFTPGVQTWALSRFAPATPALTITTDHLDLGLHRSQLKNLRLVQPGRVLTLPSVELEVDALNAALRSVKINRLIAKNWVLDLTAAPPASTSSPAAAGHASSAVEQQTRDGLNGLLAQLKLPIDLAIEGVELDGEIILPQGRAHVVITGGGLSVGHDGNWAFAIDLTGPAKPTLNIRGELTARMLTPRTFERITLAVTSASNTGSTPHEILHGTLNLAQSTQGECYAAVLNSGARELAQVNVTLPARNAPVSGTWTIDITSADLATLAWAQPLPEFAAKGQGNFTGDVNGTQINVTANLDAWVDKLSRLSPELAALGRLGLAAKVDLAAQDQNIRLTHCEVNLSADNTLVARLQTLQPIEFNRTTGAVLHADSAVDLMRIELESLPLTWAKPFLGDYAIAGEKLRGAFTLAALNDGIAIRTATPLTLQNVSLSRAGQPQLQNLDAYLSVQADYSSQGWKAEINPLVITTSRATLITLTAKASQLSGAAQPLSINGTYQVALPALLAQPAMAGSIALTQGVARGDFNASLAATKTASLTLQLSELVAATKTSGPLPAFSFAARATVDAAGKITAQVPVVITQGTQRSDCTVDAVIIPTSDGTSINAQVTSKSLSLPDLLSCNSLFSRLSPNVSSRPAPPTDETQTERPTALPAKPLWDGFTGELNIDLNSLVYSKALQMNAIKGNLTLTPTALNMNTLAANFSSGGRLAATSQLQFDSQQPQPYALKADVAVTELDSAPLLRALALGRPSPVEGKFTLTTQLAGRAQTPTTFSDTVIGDIALNSQAGILRIIDVRTASNADVVGNVAAIAGFLGTLARSEAIVKEAAKVRAAAVVAGQLSAIAYNQLNVVVGRDAEHNLAVKDLSLTSPQILLQGSGKITQQVGVPLLQQPLQLTLKLKSSEPLSSSLRTLKLLDETTDAQGYSNLIEDVQLDGSLQAIGAAQLQRLINRAKAAD